MTRYTVGASAEREWQRILQARGHLVTRSSGSADLYDLHSTDQQGRSFLWEVKSTSASTKYFRRSELERLGKLSRAAKRHGIRAFVPIKFRGRDSFFLVLTPELIIRYGKISRDRPPAALLAHYYCPTCLTRYEFSKPDIADAEPSCGYCHTALQEEAMTVSNPKPSRSVEKRR